MRIKTLAEDQGEFIQKYGEFIHKEISNCYPRIKQAVEFLTRIENYVNLYPMLAITILLDFFPEENSTVGVSMFMLQVQCIKNVTFSLLHNEREVAVLEIEGFDWNADDVNTEYKIRKKREEEQNGPELLYP